MYLYTCTCPTYYAFCIQSAVGYEYQAGLSKHQSQTDGSKGFGGKYGVDTENQDAVSAYKNTVLYI